MSFSALLRRELGLDVLESEAAVQNLLDEWLGPTQQGATSSIPGEWGADLPWNYSTPSRLLFESDSDEANSSDAESAEETLRCEPRAFQSSAASTGASRSAERPRQHSPPPRENASAAPKAEQIDARWLLSKCVEYVARSGAQVPSTATANSILGTFRETSGEAELQGRLFDLLGELGLDLMSEILNHKTEIAKLRKSDLDAAAAAAAAAAAGGQGVAGGALAFSDYENFGGMVPEQQGLGQQGLVGLAGSKGRGRPVQAPSVAASITVQTASDRALEKLRRKEARRQGKQRDGGGAYASAAAAGQVAWLEALQAGAVHEQQLAAMAAATANMSPEDAEAAMIASLAPQGSTEYQENRSGLPADATRDYVAGYWEEVHIPARPRPLQARDDELVQISSLEGWAQPAFAGTRALNRMQSAVYNCAFKSTENMLICAPTGAGKTNVAMLALLRLVKSVAVAHGVVQKRALSGVKAVYVAPMKALAQEVVAKFSQRLKPLGLVVREYTGDMQLTRQEVESSHLLVTTPEKWDVVTRKGGDGPLTAAVGLLLIDEVHLLADDRGAVIESVVARLQRQVEQTQRLVRIVGLSATLPNYKDVGQFLGVSPSGLFYFGPEHRPVPLAQTFVGVTEKQRGRQQQLMVRVAYEKALAAVRDGKQVMVFVHARKDTVRTAQSILELAARDSTASAFSTLAEPSHAEYAMQVAKSRNKEVRELFSSGFGCHHAGMLRPDRTLTERAFESGAIKVLICTATLAWGINLPAHTVIVKGTEVYSPEKGGMQPLSMLDVLQIFGRAGRPQFDTDGGHAIMITLHKDLDYYLAKLAKQTPIESSFIKALPDHLNAEIAAGTVTNVSEGASWLGYTYLFVRMQKNPSAYGMPPNERETDPQLNKRRTELIQQAAAVLDEFRMVRYDPRSGNLAATDLGRTASHFYISHESVYRFNQEMKAKMSDAQILRLICRAAEFDQVKARQEELQDMDNLLPQLPLEVLAPVEESTGKATCLLQAYIGNLPLKNFTLISDSNYVAQNGGRVARALFEAALRKGWASLARRLLEVAKSIDRRVWWFQSPLRQFPGELPFPALLAIEEKCGNDVTRLRDMTAAEAGDVCRSVRLGPKVLQLAHRLPQLALNATVQPVTRGVLRVSITLRADFEWVPRYHGGAEGWWVWLSDADGEQMYHHEQVIFRGHRHNSNNNSKDASGFGTEEHVLTFSVPAFEPLPPQYWIHAASDKWIGCTAALPLTLRNVKLPPPPAPHTELMDLTPLPFRAVGEETAEIVFGRRGGHFNPIQTQVFHVAYHTDLPILLGAPTGSGKTAIADLAVLRLLNKGKGPSAKAVYVAPLKALARERLRDWGERFGKLGVKVIEMTGDTSPDAASLRDAHILVTTPEKWDLVTRGWQRRQVAKLTELVILDEVHLLGEERGPVLEVIVSRMRYVAEMTSNPVRFVALSTALANARDLADWLGIPSDVGLYNFRPSVRPIPCEVHIQGFPGRYYCPRMATMNKPVFAAILEHSPDKPALVFVASRRQTRLTALELISLCAGSDQPERFLRMPEEEAHAAAEAVRDPALKHTLLFGIGIHHAGLDERDRAVVESLFCDGKIQVLVCTSTLAWGVNFPAHLVVVKGTEFFDGKMGRYVDFPVTDVLQMIGRAGRPQFDTSAVAVILVHEPKKNFYKKFLYEPFPVESQLAPQLPNHLNAEVAAGVITTNKLVSWWLTRTFLFRRLLANPAYYGAVDGSNDGVSRHLASLAEGAIATLESAGCVAAGGAGSEPGVTALKATPLGEIASRFYIDYRTAHLLHKTFSSKTKQDMTLPQLCRLLADCHEFSELPVRHNEDALNAELAATLPWPVGAAEDFSSPHCKAFLLLQAHFARAKLPISDYAIDSKGLLEQAPRVNSAAAEVAALAGRLSAFLGILRLGQMTAQALTDDADPLENLPGIGPENAKKLRSAAAAAAGPPAAGAAAAAVTGTSARRRQTGGGSRSGANNGSSHGVGDEDRAAGSRGLSGNDLSLREVLRRLAPFEPGSLAAILGGSGAVGRALPSLRALPLLNASWTMDCSGSGGSGGSGASSGGNSVSGALIWQNDDETDPQAPAARDSSAPIAAGSKQTLLLRLSVSHGTGIGRPSVSRAARATDIGWCAVLGTSNGHLLAWRRVGRVGSAGSGGGGSGGSGGGGGASTEVRLPFEAPQKDSAGKEVQLLLYLVADVAMGLDLSIPLRVRVV